MPEAGQGQGQQLGQERQHGLLIPAVPLPATDGRCIDLSAHIGRALLIVYPYTGRPGHPNPPHWDDIPGAHGSTPELEGFRDCAAEFAEIGIDLFGLSRQTADWQRETAARLELPFPLLSDDGEQLWPGLALETFETGGALYLKRITLLIGNGRVQARFSAPDPAGHAAELLAQLR